ncbi:uncharacterized protein LOC143491565 [Brachyhypopomus gauderio]|uniref:uncharacterized protein LOC143491565 n=1 Tax=Brachyhypopomus gauderio TaxID=698409 RepID=UPI004040ED0C
MLSFTRQEEGAKFNCAGVALAHSKMSLEPFSIMILDMAKQDLSSTEISAQISEVSGGARGCSARNVRRFCNENGLSLMGLPDEHLELEVAKAITETGPTFGRRMMNGYLAMKGVYAAEKRISSALRTIHQPYHEARQRGARNLNPIPYQADYMGQKVHLDQNEKLTMFGVTHVVAIDGFSKKVVAHSTMPIKNNLAIYEEVFRPAVLTYGMWDQVRVDHGKEFYLTLFMQELLSSHRHNQERSPYLQTSSTRNHIVERIWPEVNNRVNYPLKTALLQLVDQEELDMNDSLVRYCVSNLTGRLCEIGVKRLVESWNAHYIPGKGIPNDLARQGCPKKIPLELLPHSAEAADLYNQQLGSSLTPHSTFGVDPFSSEQDKITVESQFAEQYSDISELFSRAVNNDFAPYKQALLCLITTTQRNV